MIYTITYNSSKGNKLIGIGWLLKRELTFQVNLIIYHIFLNIILFKDIIMLSVTKYDSPVGNLTLACRDNKLTNIYFDKQEVLFNKWHYDGVNIDGVAIFKKTKEWLDSYFKGEYPSYNKLKFDVGGGDFTKQIAQVLTDIPPGSVLTYNEIADKLESKAVTASVAQAINKNTIPIIVPCHRAVASNNELNNYVGGLERKKNLLKFEGVKIENLKVVSSKPIFI